MTLWPIPAGNTRNGKSKKTLKGDFGELPIEIPQDRHGSFEPQIVTKQQTRWSGVDEKNPSLYARGMTVRDIQSHLQEMYRAEVSPTLISSVTDSVMDDVKPWQARPLDALYPIVYLDCIHIKTRDVGVFRSKAVYLALGISMQGGRKSWACGLPKPKAPSSSCKWSPSSKSGGARHLYRLRRWFEGFP